MIFQAWTPIDSSLTADAREQVSKAQDDKMAESVVDDVVELCKLLGPALSFSLWPTAHGFAFIQECWSHCVEFF